MTKELTNQELEKYARGKIKSMPFDIEKIMAKQLLSTMQENAKLRTMFHPRWIALPGGLALHRGEWSQASAASLTGAPGPAKVALRRTL